MKTGMAVGLLLAFAATSALEAYGGARPRSGGGPAGGGAGHFARGFSSGARYGGGSGAAYYGNRAVPRGSAGGYVQPPGAQYRHPRAGTGTGGYYYGHGHGYGYGHGYGHYPYYGYGYYPYYAYPYYPYYGGFAPWGFGLGLSFYYGDTYAAPSYYVGPPAGNVTYYGGGGYYGGGDSPAYGSAEIPADAAEVLLEVVPDDASVWIDDQFRGPARDLARLVLPPGRHRVEIVRPGFRTATQELDLRPGTSSALRIALER